jgi:hypothetical protein
MLGFESAARGGEGWMAGREGPTNERIVTLLREILQEMKDLRVRQERIETSLEKVARTTR